MVFEPRFPSSLFKNHNIIIFICLMITALMFFACGSDKSDETLKPGMYTAYTVSGLEYECLKISSGQKTRTGATNDDGQFYYKEGEEIQFSVGEISLGAGITPKFKLTPLDMTIEKNELISNSALNVSLFLQSLDEDLNKPPSEIDYDCPEDDDVDCDCTDGSCDVSNFSNGINITRSVRDAIRQSGITLNFDQSPETFVADAKVTELFEYLNSKGESVFWDSPERKMLTTDSAKINLKAALAENKALPVIIINLGDGLTCGTQSGLTHEYTQVNGFAQKLGSQIGNASNFAKWMSPKIDLKNLCLKDNTCKAQRYFLQSRKIELEENEKISDEYSTNTEDIIDTLLFPWPYPYAGADSDYGLVYPVPTNYAIEGATTDTLINDKVTEVELIPDTLIDAVLGPLRKLANADDISIKKYAGEGLSQLDAADFMARLHPDKQKIFTVWIGLNDVLEAIKDPENPMILGSGSKMTEEDIKALLGSEEDGTDLFASVKENLDTIINTLKAIPDSHIFIANLPEITDLGFLLDKNDIESIVYLTSEYDDDNRENVKSAININTLDDNEYIGLLPFMNRQDALEEGVYKILNESIGTPIIQEATGNDFTVSDTNEVIAKVNGAITRTLNASDAYSLSFNEANLLNNLITEINTYIKTLTQDEDSNVTLIDLKSDIFEKLHAYPVHPEYEFDDLKDGAEEKIKGLALRDFLYITTSGDSEKAQIYFETAEDKRDEDMKEDMEDWEYRILSRSFGGGFYSLDGVHPSNIGHSLIANKFIEAINEKELGLDIDEISESSLYSQYSSDPYQDDDEDGFVPGPVTKQDDDFWEYDDVYDQYNAIYPLYEGIKDCSDSYDSDLSPYAEGKDEGTCN